MRDSDTNGTKDLAGWTRVSTVQEFDILTEPKKIFGKEVIIVLNFDSDNHKTKRIFFWDDNYQQWRPLRSEANYSGKTVRAYTHLPYSRVAVFEQEDSREGLASWYRSSRTYTAASNDFPIGSNVKVINVENGARVTVKIVSTGPFVPGRIVDLEYSAFAAIANPSEGVAKVVVEPTDDGQGAQSASAPAAAGAPGITARSGFVWDPGSGQELYNKDADVVRPIASISKLMTAVIFLESDPDWDRVFSMNDSDIPKPISGVTIHQGDITIRDLFEAMLTGSANNAAYALARSTGLSRDEFVRRMNQRAKDIAMTRATFKEPSGLDPGNQASARDVAKLVAYVSHRLGLAQVTIRGTDSYYLHNTGETRTIRNPLYLAPGLSAPPIFSAKTGYLDEALYTLGVKAVRNGVARVIVVLGSSSRTTRNSDVAGLINWSLP
jgi:D-alanyl-D-alanine endopeptidase (penicillin-binding protein 7)